MVASELGGGGLVTLPTAETFYWLPCRLDLPKVEGEPPMPHAFFIASNFEFRVWCEGCRPRARPGKAASVVAWTGEAREAGRGAAGQSYAGQGPVGHGEDTSISRGAGEAVLGTGVAPAAVGHGSARHGEAWRSEESARDDVADFSRPPPTSRPPPESVMYRPVRGDMERAEYWEERAAIFEYLGGNDRWIAERLAYEELRRAIERKELR